MEAIRSFGLLLKTVFKPLIHREIDELIKDERITLIDSFLTDTFLNGRNLKEVSIEEKNSFILSFPIGNQLSLIVKDNDIFISSR